MSYTLDFEINDLPLPTNQQMSMHWTKKGAYVKHWHRMVSLLVGSKKPTKPLPKAVLTLTRFSSSEPDFDGLVSSFKPVIDALIVCGVLVNDKPSNIGQSKYLWEKAKPKQGKIKIKVEEV